MTPPVTLAGLCTLFAALLWTAPAQAENPIVPGWYADPELRLYENRFWIYPTYSDDYGEPYRSDTFSQWQTEQRARTDRVWPPFLKHTFFHAFSSEDMVHWKMHPFVLDVKDVAWAAYSLWAPSAIEHNGKYYLFFGANDIKDNEQVGGIGVALSDQPQGPFRDAIGKPLIDRFHNGAQPIDQMVFKDDDGKVYLIYGGWKHCNIVRLSDDLLSVQPHDDGSVFKEITPSPDYVEGPFMIKRKGIYYLMWSEGDWTGPDYRVGYATANNPTGPFEPGGVILAQDDQIARGAGHHSVLNIPGTDDWYIAYHRRPLGETNGNHRELAIERMKFDDDGSIQPVKMTKSGTGTVHLNH
ncbi:glycoside hydrolase family 43 protein [Asticcacaulis sp. AC402]|uniref:glycoside hydrolase family 43 protein n=1 Tax=Asticcacaulis sp. AC402 TaxID=1282361 RepID=UPI0003C3C16D|nr:glycoside hydrolase family 43 protein [Asticcacaulis sp. AC402]ESQ75156.1 hypothetical protein ABAC402_10835 [Asticcacaulis sp. AC402]